MGHGLKLKTSQEKGFLRIAMVGEFPADFDSFYTRVTTIMNLSGQKRFLFDVRELLGWPDHQATHDFVSTRYPEPSGFRSAILDLPQHVAYARFYETMLHNRGYDTRVFKDEAEAITWLLG